MAMPQRDNAIEEIKRLDMLLEYAVEHGDEAEAERLREERHFASLDELKAQIQKDYETITSSTDA